MTRLITTTILIHIVLALTAQTNNLTLFVGNVISDTTTFKCYDYHLSLTSILKSENKIEIRFITSPSLEAPNEAPNYTIITFNKHWDVKHYYYKPGTDSLFVKGIRNQIKIDTVISRLVANNIFSLPDQNSLTTINLTYNPVTNQFIEEILRTTDGICYYIEFKVGERYRRYHYCNPNSYKNFYTQVDELRKFANIVEIFNEWLK